MRGTVIQYRAISALLAVRFPMESDRRAFLTVSPGTIVKIEGEPNQDGIVNAAINGEHVLVFQRDLDDRAVLDETEDTSL
jgi:hypothetical protein